MKIIVLLILLPLILFSMENQCEAIIFIKPEANKIEQFAASELSHHMQLILKQDIQIVTNPEQKPTCHYKFYVGSGYVNKSPFKKEEARYIIQNDKIFIGGDDLILNGPKSDYEAVASMQNRTGTLSAVYDFLYNEMGVRWIQPSDIGICCKSLKQLSFKNKTYSWLPAQSFRIFRNDIWQWKKLTNSKLNMYVLTPGSLWVNQDDVQQQEMDEIIWKRRMKQGTNDMPSYGHAFTDYWFKYGRNHPEWFALGENGNRGIEGRRDRESKYLKFCVSNDELQNEIVKNWQQDNHKDTTYNACENDGSGYCRCAKCRVLDGEDISKKPSSDFERESKSDRYVYFWNSLVKKSKLINPNGRVIAYAYDAYRYGPKKQILANDIILGFVPDYSDTPQKTASDMTSWQKHGLKDVFLRPNDFNDDIGMPMGHEKYIFDKFQVFKDFNIIGLDYDRNYNYGNWAYEGISYYILSLSIAQPSRSFAELEDDYYNTFDSAKDEIKSFYQYWRKNFETKRLPKIQKFGGFSGRTNMYINIKEFYTLNDFRITDQYLSAAVNKTTNPAIQSRIKRLMVANTHSKLLYLALIDRNANYKSLIDYRIKYKNDLNLAWPMVFYVENSLINLDRKKGVLNYFFQ